MIKETYFLCDDPDCLKKHSKEAKSFGYVCLSFFGKEGNLKFELGKMVDNNEY